MGPQELIVELNRWHHYRGLHLRLADVPMRIEWELFPPKDDVSPWNLVDHLVNGGLVAPDREQAHARLEHLYTCDRFIYILPQTEGSR